MLATLVRLLGDLDQAEEALHEAFAASMDVWPTIDAMRRLALTLREACGLTAADARERRDGLHDSDGTAAGGHVRVQ